MNNPYEIPSKDLNYNNTKYGAGTNLPILQATSSATTVYIQFTTFDHGNGWIKIYPYNPVVIASSGITTEYSPGEEIPVMASKTYKIVYPVTKGGTISDLSIKYHIHKYDQNPTITSIGTIEGHKLKKQCSCGKWSDEDETEAHTWKKSYTVAPTFTEKGYTIYTCEGCKGQKQVYDTNKIPHSYS